jgi:hypothetical protein
VKDFKSLKEGSGGNGQFVQTFRRPEFMFHDNFEKETFCEDTTTREGRHYTTPDGHKYPSITTVLGKSKPQKDIDGLDAWRNRVGREKAQEITVDAATRGTKLHKLVENFICNDKDIYEVPDARNARLFKQIHPLIGRVGEIHVIEKALYSDILKVAGRVDLIGEFDGKLSVIDFKGSTKEKREDWILDYFLQETFYSVAFGAIFGDKISQIVTIMAVEETGMPQLFIKKPKDYLGRLVERIGIYNATHS